MKRAALKAAAQWHAQLGSHNVSEQDRQAWQTWLAANELHGWAWKQVELLRGRIEQQRQHLPSELAASALQIAATLPKKRPSRRIVLKGMAIAFIGSATAWSAWRQQDHILADYATAIGERRTLTLADGSTLILNTDTVVNVRFTEMERRLILKQGEILIQTARDPHEQGKRQFIVETPQGELRALGTRFTVREENARTQIAVLESAVEIRPAKAERTRILQTGEQAAFDAHDIDIVTAANEDQTRWIDGMLVVNDRALRDVLHELGRYRRGYLGCTDDVAHLRISGTFPIDDTDLAVLAIAKVLPVTVVSRTRYWVTLTGLE